MKRLIPLSILLLLPLPSLAGGNSSQRGYSQEQTCYENVYREEYIPGTRNNPGRIVRRDERVEVPCNNSYNSPAPVTSNTDDNSCIEGSILGGIAGAAGGAALSRDEGMFIGIPLGIVGGALIGCQIDGG